MAILEEEDFLFNYLLGKCPNIKGYISSKGFTVS